MRRLDPSSVQAALPSRVDAEACPAEAKAPTIACLTFSTLGASCVSTTCGAFASAPSVSVSAKLLVWLAAGGNGLTSRLGTNTDSAACASTGCVGVRLSTVGPVCFTIVAATPELPVDPNGDLMVPAGAVDGGMAEACRGAFEVPPGDRGSVEGPPLRRPPSLATPLSNSSSGSSLCA